MGGINSSLPNENGFLHLDDIILRQQQAKIFSAPDGEPDDIIDRLNEQKEKKEGAVFDFRLGKEYFVTGEKTPKYLTAGQPWLKIEPGQFGLLTSYETIHMPLDLIALISMRFSKKKAGLVNVSGFHIDPGYDGKIVFSVYNAGPNTVSLKLQDDIFMATFSKISRPISDKKPGRRNLTQDDWIALMGGANMLSPQEIAEKIGRLEVWNKVAWAIAAPAVAAVIYLLTQVGK